MIKPFSQVRAIKPKRSVFDLSYSKLLSADMGLLYPIMADEVVPGDSWHIGAKMVARVMPLVAPLLHQITVFCHYYFVPYRLLWNLWEQFITGGENGQDASVPPRMPYPGDVAFDAGNTLWDYFGFPKSPTGTVTATTTLPLDFIRRAYSFIFDEYYRDENLQTKLGINYSDVLLRHAYRKDYLTSALPWAQRGIAPAMPLTGSAPITGATTNDSRVTLTFQNLPIVGGAYDFGTDTVVAGAGTGQVGDTSPGSAGHTNDNFNGTPPVAAVAAGDLDTDGLAADLSTASTYDINDLRLAWQIQRFMERNARVGVRYTEFLHGIFGESPHDSRMMRPEYIGGFRAPVIVSEVLQTSETTVNSAQGTMAGHGISIANTKAASYHAQEYGLIIGLMSIRPEPMYHQGVNRQWLRRSRYDFYFPQFAHLGEQAIEESEVYWQDTDADNTEVFGFQGRYDEMRFKSNMVVGALRPGQSMDYWTLCRDFDSPPDLNASFIECNPDPRSWAVQTGAPQFLVHFGNQIKAIRPLPIVGEPGMVDHD